MMGGEKKAIESMEEEYQKEEGTRSKRKNKETVLWV